MAKFKKCPRCDLNYILEEEDLCDICKKELNGVNFGEIDEAEDELDEICPVCRINFLEEGETICPACLEKQQAEEDRRKALLAEDFEEDEWEENEEEEEEDLSDLDLSFESLKEEEEDWDTENPLEDEEEDY
jgi:hypothetical protein